jgi:hypothetical protein
MAAAATTSIDALLCGYRMIYLFTATVSSTDALLFRCRMIYFLPPVHCHHLHGFFASELQNDPFLFKSVH